MSRPTKHPLRPLTSAERRSLEQLARSQSAPALSVARARALLAVSEGSSYTDAAHLAGHALGDSVAGWVARFNQVGLTAVERQAGGRPPTQYGPEERDRTWCQTGEVIRKRKRGEVKVHDPDTSAKKA